MEKRLSQLTIALTVIGLLVAAYMTVYAITSNDNMCVGSKDCSVVNASKYSKINIAGITIPVAVLGVAGYAAILAVLLLEPRVGFLEQNGSLIFFGLALMGFLFTLSSLGVSLYRFAGDASIDEIVSNFGVAVTSTICGIA